MSVTTQLFTPVLRNKKLSCGTAASNVDNKKSCNFSFFLVIKSKISIYWRIELEQQNSNQNNWIITHDFRLAQDFLLFVKFLPRRKYFYYLICFSKLFLYLLYLTGSKLQYLPLASVSSFVQDCNINYFHFIADCNCFIYDGDSAINGNSATDHSQNVLKLWYVLELYEYHNVPVLGKNTKHN